MIFVTIGSMFPFDRLVRAMDAWADAHPQVEILAQIGEGAYLPARMKWARKLDRAAYAEAVAGAELVVAHAGMGSVISAGERGRPIVLLPRSASLGEHNNDHQHDTARWLRTRPGIWVAGDETELAACVDAARAAGPDGAALGLRASPDFLARLRAFAAGEAPGARKRH